MMAIGWELSEQLHAILIVFVDNMEAIFVDKGPDKTATEFVGADFRSHMVLLPTNFIDRGGLTLFV